MYAYIHIYEREMEGKQNMLTTCLGKSPLCKDISGTYFYKSISAFSVVMIVRSWGRGVGSLRSVNPYLL